MSHLTRGIHSKSPPLEKGGQGGFLGFVTILRRNSFLSAYSFSAAGRGKSGPYGAAKMA